MGKIKSDARQKTINAIKAAGAKGITGRNLKLQTGVSQAASCLRAEDMVAEEQEQDDNDIIYYWVGEK